MDLQLAGKLALVTGSTAGIGLAIAKALAGEGARGHRQRPDRGARRRRHGRHRQCPPVGPPASRSPPTSAPPEGAELAIAALSRPRRSWSTISAFSSRARSRRSRDDEWERMIEVNFMSGVRLSRHYLPRMKATGWGRIIFIASELAVNIPIEMIHYGVTKTMQVALARGLAETTVGTGVTVNSVLPGPTRSEGVEQFVQDLAKVAGQDRGGDGAGVLRDRPADLAPAAVRDHGRDRGHGRVHRQPAVLGHQRGGASAPTAVCSARSCECRSSGGTVLACGARIRRGRQVTQLLEVAPRRQVHGSPGRIFVTGIQALVRLPLMQRQRDLAAGLNTAGYITGYRGSPLGTYDQQLERAKAHLDAHHIVHRPGVNEDLAATACSGTQQVGLDGESRYDGVFAIWYAKGPGVDRSGDAIRHGNLFGTARHGGVLLLLGDDHICESSTTAHQSEYAMVDALVPVLNPAGVQEILEYGLLGIAMSRFTGGWVALKCVHDTVESTASIPVDPASPAILPARRTSRRRRAA